MRLFATDLDGTLLYNNKISEKNQRALRELVDHGIMVVFVTGRVATSARYIADTIGISVPIVANNGAFVLSKEGEILDHHPLPFSEVEPILDYCRQHRLYYHFYDQDTLYTEYYREKRLHHLSITSPLGVQYQVGLSISQDPLREVTLKERKINKVLIECPDQESIQAIKRQFPHFYTTMSHQTTVEIMQKGIDKWTGLLKIMDHYGIDASETVAIGDYDNDIPFIREAAMGIAMGNACDALLKEADFVTLSNREDGVAFAISKIKEKFGRV